MRLVVALLSDQQEFQRLQAESARRFAALERVQADVVFADNAIGQIQQIYRFIHAPAEQRPSAIIVQPLGDEWVPKLARAAAAAGIGWICLARKAAPYLAKLRAEYPRLPLGSVTVDQREVGCLQGRQILALAGTSGTVLYVQGPPEASSAQLRLQGTRDTLAGSSIDLKVLEGDWMESGGQAAVRAWLRLKTSDEVRPVVVAAQNDAMAEGAQRALAASVRRAEFSGVRFIGCDGLPESGQRRVKMRQLAATIVIPPNTAAAMELALRALRGAVRLPLEVLLKPQGFPEESALAPLPRLGAAVAAIEEPPLLALR